MGEIRNAYRLLVLKSLGKRLLGITRRIWEDNTELRLVMWMQVDRCGGRWHEPRLLDLVLPVLNLRILLSLLLLYLISNSFILALHINDRLVEVWPVSNTRMDLHSSRTQSGPIYRIYVWLKTEKCDKCAASVTQSRDRSRIHSAGGKFCSACGTITKLLFVFETIDPRPSYECSYVRVAPV
jgi:hypothetical protein